MLRLWTRRAPARPARRTTRPLGMEALETRDTPDGLLAAVFGDNSPLALLPTPSLPSLPTLGEVRDGLASAANTATNLAVTAGSPVLGTLNQIAGNPLGRDAANITGAVVEGTAQVATAAANNLGTALADLPVQIATPGPGPAGGWTTEVLDRLVQAADQTIADVATAQANGTFPAAPTLQTPGAVLAGAVAATGVVRDAGLAVADNVEPLDWVRDAAARVTRILGWPAVSENTWSVADDLTAVSLPTMIALAGRMVGNEAGALSLWLSSPGGSYQSPFLSNLAETATLETAGASVDSALGVTLAVSDWVAHTLSLGYFGGKESSGYDTLTGDREAFDRGYNTIGGAYRVFADVMLIADGVAKLPQLLQSLRSLPAMSTWFEGGVAVTEGGPAWATGVVLTDEAYAAIRAAMAAAAKAGWPLGAGAGNLGSDAGAVFMAAAPGGGSSTPATVPSEIDPNKFNYIFGEVTSGAHNTDRSLENAMQMNRIGFSNTPLDRAVLIRHFQEVVQNPSNIIRSWTKQLPDGQTVVLETRESLLQGPGGFVKIESTWQVMPDGLRRLTTIIPFGG